MSLMLLNIMCIYYKSTERTVRGLSEDFLCSLEQKIKDHGVAQVASPLYIGWPCFPSGPGQFQVMLVVLEQLLFIQLGQ